MQKNSSQRWRLQWLLLIVGASSLAACQSPAPVPAAPDPALIKSLISRGDAAAANGHWDEPAANSARDYYQRARLLDPDSLPIRRRIETIVERYLTRARSAAEQHSHRQAAAWLQQARQVDAEHAGVAPTTAYLEMLASAQRQELDIDRAPLGERTATLANRLKDYGSRARAPDCRTLIRAGNDADGRWIYQQLAQSPGSQRIRAQFEIGTPARVAVLCQP
ncbi:MAG: hypothetical protein AB8B93_14315 [Pseudomonadales bacterium]